MPSQINAEIIAIGTEILLGEITDTNSVFIARVLRNIGINLYYMTSVGDNEERIADAIRIAMSRANVVITCGGLGPTIDDMTRQGVAKATHRELVFHQGLLDVIAERFASFRAQMTENNKRQAYLPANATLIENPVGTAPSFIVEHESKVVISLPGVPREMKYLLNEQVVPYLREHFQLGGLIIKARVLRTAGIGESLLDSQIGAKLLEMNNPTIGLAAHAGQVDIRITAKAESETDADLMIAEVEQQIRERVDQFIFGTDEDRIEQVLAKMLAKNQSKLLLIEAGVETSIMGKLERVPETMGYLAPSQVYTHPLALATTLNLDPQMPIRELAESAARKAIAEGVTSAIVVVSYPEMNEQHDDRESGTAIAVTTESKLRSRVYGFGGQGEVASEWSGLWSMSTLWQMLKEEA